MPALGHKANKTRHGPEERTYSDNDNKKNDHKLSRFSFSCCPSPRKEAAALAATFVRGDAACRPNSGHHSGRCLVIRFMRATPKLQVKSTGCVHSVRCLLNGSMRNQAFLAWAISLRAASEINARQNYLFINRGYPENPYITRSGFRGSGGAAAVQNLCVAKPRGPSSRCLGKASQYWWHSLLGTPEAARPEKYGPRPSHVYRTAQRQRTGPLFSGHLHPGVTAAGSRAHALFNDQYTGLEGVSSGEPVTPSNSMSEDRRRKLEYRPFLL